MAEPCADPVRLLRDRADSYWQDSVVLREDGDLHAAVAYKMIAEELRRCAEVLRANDPPPVPLVPDPKLRTHLIGSGTPVPPPYPAAKHTGDFGQECVWCHCVGYHSEVCEGFTVNDPAAHNDGSAS